MAPSKKDSYHHGNLREALLDTALETLQSESLESLSLRGLAKAQGVSPTAVYGHFTDKTELLVELKTLGFHQLSDAMAEALGALPAPAAAEDELRALGRAYIDFARGNPNLFDVLFSWNPDHERLSQECIEAGSRAEGLLRETIVRLLGEQGVMDESQAAEASFSAWALVHGISTLLITGSVEGAIYCDNWPEAFSERHPESQQRVLDELMNVQIAGLKARYRLDKA